MKLKIKYDDKGRVSEIEVDGEKAEIPFSVPVPNGIQTPIIHQPYPVPGSTGDQYIPPWTIICSAK